MSFMDSWHIDWDIYDDIIMEKKEVADYKNFAVSGGYYFDTEAEALTAASRRAAKNNEDFKVYKAIKLVSPTTPAVNVTDVVIS